MSRLLLITLIAALALNAEVSELRIPTGAGGVGFLPLLVMEKHQLIEKHAKEAGIANLKVRWINIGGPSVMNDALLSGSADFITAGPPAFITLWDRTFSSAKVQGVGAMSSMPMYLNARTDRLKKLDDVKKDPRVKTIMLSDDVMGGSTTFTMVSTTTKFREQNPKVYGAVLKAIEEANRMIDVDKKSAAELLLASTNDKGFSVNEIVEVLSDPHVKFTTTPENVMKYADFMHSIGSIRNRPASWKDMFFPEIQGAPGS
jgi:ABC-type nitrate/sulfonate/bicarbonate transport system substrate-binding protein